MNEPMDPMVEPPLGDRDRDDLPEPAPDPLVERIGVILDMIESRLRAVEVAYDRDDDIPPDVPQFEVW